MKKINCVLLVDDDGVTNFINYKIVKQLDITDVIHTEFNGEKALNFIQYYAELHENNAPEIILLDLKMPVLDGYEFLEYLKFKKFDNKNDMQIIALSNQTRPDELARLERFNIKLLPKPLTLEALSLSLGINSLT
jgi:CheY-like chemotaxis protein